jgi:predicted small secreted protein
MDVCAMSADIKLIATDRFRFIAAVIAVALCLSACGHPGLSGAGDDVVERGLTIEVMKKSPGTDHRVWEKPNYYLPNGNGVYVEPILYDRAGYINCDYHWEADPQGRIVGYRLVGQGCCKHASLHDSLFCDKCR